MSQEDPQPSPQTLGAFLRDQREKNHLSLEDATESTKISLPILRAIEEDDFDRMPAEAFCRGFYSIYAEFLQLNPEEILTRYLDSRGLSTQESPKQARPPIKKSNHFSNYAEPAAVSPGASLGVLLLACLIVVGGICWYFDLTPTRYLNTQLSSSPIGAEPVQSEIETPADADPDVIINESSPDNTPPVSGSGQETLSSDSAGEIAINSGPYHLVVNFSSDGTFNVTLDDEGIIEKHVTAGETLQWEIKQKILLDMPEEISATLHINGVKHPLPQAEDGRRRLSLPEGPGTE